MRFGRLVKQTVGKLINSKTYRGWAKWAQVVMMHKEEQRRFINLFDKTLRKMMNAKVTRGWSKWTAVVAVLNAERRRKARLMRNTLNRILQGKMWLPDVFQNRRSLHHKGKKKQKLHQRQGAASTTNSFKI